ncbi:MAG: SpoIIE family protein phosphatase, partial [Deltaproteobacteria bacterium]|nr:SpoIIE family protein phosphatase [Deltaproteobacteria bacterium]
AGDVYAAVLDQAGGLGGDRRGEASALAAETIFEALKARYGAALHDRADDAMNDWTSGLANNRMPNDRAATDRAATDRAAIERDREKASASDVACLTGAYAKAHDRLVSRRQGEVTTAISLRAHSLARGGSAALLAVLVNSGDSGAFLLDSAGKVKERTQLQEWTRSPQVGALTHAIGLVPEGPAPESYVWEVEEGDWLLLCSDGLLDAGLGAAGVAKILKLSTSAEEAANRLCLRILRRMVFLLAKPDNLSVVLLRALAQRG